MKQPRTDRCAISVFLVLTLILSIVGAVYVILKGGDDGQPWRDYVSVLFITLAIGTIVPTFYCLLLSWVPDSVSKPLGDSFAAKFAGRYNKSDRWFVFLAVFPAATFFLYGYVAICYTKIPQAFGGAKPRTAQLDILSDKVSASTLDLLIDTSPVGSETKVVSSKQVSVLHTSDKYLIIDASPDDPNNSDVMELSRNAVESILWIRPKKRTRSSKEPNALSLDNPNDVNVEIIRDVGAVEKVPRRP